MNPGNVPEADRTLHLIAKSQTHHLIRRRTNLQSFSFPRLEPYLVPQNPMVMDQNKPLRENSYRAMSVSISGVYCTFHCLCLVINVEYNRAEYIAFSSKIKWGPKHFVRIKYAKERERLI